MKTKTVIHQLTLEGIVDFPGETVTMPRDRWAEVVVSAAKDAAHIEALNAERQTVEDLKERIAPLFYGPGTNESRIRSAAASVEEAEKVLSNEHAGRWEHALALREVKEAAKLLIHVAGVYRFTTEVLRAPRPAGTPLTYDPTSWFVDSVNVSESPIEGEFVAAFKLRAGEAAWPVFYTVTPAQADRIAGTKLVGSRGTGEVSPGIAGFLAQIDAPELKDTDRPYAGKTLFCSTPINPGAGSLEAAFLARPPRVIIADERPDWADEERRLAARTEQHLLQGLPWRIIDAQPGVEAKDVELRVRYTLDPKDNTIAGIRYTTLKYEVTEDDFRRLNGVTLTFRHAFSTPAATFGELLTQLGIA